MDLAQWNSALMDGLVRKFGAPGDPLYFYVDGEVLADISGMGDPQAAIDDFASAFRTTTFQSEFLKARAWQQRNFEEDPLFLTALAMSVLAVTLDPLGANSNNVYRRQRELLRARNQSGGIPDGYELTPAIWKVWNQWLKTVGAPYGTPTAYAKSGLTYQGWARSQAFLRHQDKQDIYKFFRDCQGKLSDKTSGADLVSLLDSWLQTQGSRSRLARLAGDSSIAEELAVALKASFKYWEGEQEAAERPLHFHASALWDPDEEVFDLVVTLKGVRGVIGKTVWDFDGEGWELDSHIPYLALSSASTDAGSWLGEPVHNWQFADNWRVSWTPPSNGTIFFEPDALGLNWVSTPVPDTSGRVKVLVANDDLEAVYGRLGRDGQTDRSDRSVGRKDSVAKGYSWLTIDGESEFTSAAVANLLPQSVAPKPRNHRLVGGLKLRDRSYLVGFEPDVELTFHPAGPEPKATLNDRPVDLLADSEVRSVGDSLVGTCSLREESLDRGEHTLVVSVGEQKNTSALRRSSHTAPPLREPRVVRRVHNDVVHFSLSRAREPQLIMVTSRGDIMRLSPDDSPRAWIAALEEVSGAPAPERYFDSSLLDWARQIPPRRQENILLAVRPDPGCAWHVMHTQGDPAQLAAPPRVSQSTPATAWQVVELFGKGVRHIFANPEAKTLFSEHRKKFSRNLRDALRSPASPPRSNRPLPVKPPEEPDGRVIADNPFDSFMFWLTELGDHGALYSTAEAGFNWLWRRTSQEDPPAFKDTVRLLESLGHVQRTNGKVKVQQPSLTWLPDSEALAVIAGARTGETLDVLESGEDSADGRQDDALRDTVYHAYTQQRADSQGGRLPIAPTTVLMQLGESRPPGKLAHVLGMEFYNPSFDELLDGIPDLKERLGERADPVLLGGAAKVDEYIGSKWHLGGRWRQLSGGIAKLRGSAFLKIHRGSGKQYVWWNKGDGTLVNCGWVVGQWAFHQNTDAADLFALGPYEDDFAVSAELPLPPDLEHFLVMRSGLLPRSARVRVRALGGPTHKEWRIYTNVPKSIAALASKKLGHVWSRTDNSWPSELKDSEVEFTK